MDGSTNELDLRYLTNPVFIQNLNIKETETSTIRKKDLKRFKSRIFELTRDILLGKGDINDSIMNSFNEYAKTCIKHFKFTDKSNMIQEDYANYDSIKNKIKDISNNYDYNKLIMKERQKQNPIMNFVEIKNKKKEELILPKIRKIKVKNKKNKGKK
jgi:hypothetical protein